MLGEQLSVSLSSNIHVHILFGISARATETLITEYYQTHLFFIESFKQQCFLFSHQCPRYIRDVRKKCCGPPQNINDWVLSSMIIWNHRNFIPELYYVTWGGHATDAAPGAPMPEHGKSLGKIAAADFKGLVEKGLVQYGKLSLFTSIHVFR